LIVRKVPSEVCLSCGERYYPADALISIEQRFKAIHDEHQPPERTVEVPVEAFLPA